MFSWNISKSAEAMFSRWAMRRLCQFMLKKKLGKFILGDIDLDQLDVQLGAGTIQLSDLALNVDYLNEKFGATAVLVKEGTIGSLMVTMPWMDGGCRVELDEVEIVLAPRNGKVSRDEYETCLNNKRNPDSVNSHDIRNIDEESCCSRVANASIEIHEGVKTIAKLVKWLLTSFHVKVRGLIMAFDPCMEEGDRKGLDRMLVLRIREVECGTQISDDNSCSSFGAVHNFLGLGRLTNFLKFHGAVLELLHVDCLDHLSSPKSSAGISSGNSLPGYYSSGNRTTVISGEKEGFSGSLKLSLPWKNSSLDISKVDADLVIEPLELRLQPSTIRCLMFISDMFKGMGSEGQGYSTPSHYFTSPSSCLHPSGKDPVGNEGFGLSSYLMHKEPASFLLSESHLISDWVSRRQEDRNEEEPDFVASVDQFFECFDGLRHSQSGIGNSAMWNWTCSVFSAITVASNLASGSVQVPPEQQYGETKFNAAIAKVSLLLFFSDEDPKHCPRMMDDKTYTGSHTHSLCAQFVDLNLAFQVHAQEMNFEAAVQHIQLDDHLYQKNDVVNNEERDFSETTQTVVALMRKMQDGVHGSLQSFKDCKKDSGVHHPVDNFVNVSSSFQENCECSHMINGQKDDRVSLLKTSGVSQCHFRIKSSISGGSIKGQTYFSLKLPPFVCWVNFDLISLAQDFVEEMANSVQPNIDVECLMESETKNDRFSPLGDQPKTSSTRSSRSSNQNALEGSVSLPSARIILCFPLKKQQDLCSYSSCDQFVVFEFSSRTTEGNDIKQIPVAGAKKKHLVKTPCSLDLNFSDFYLFFIRPLSAEKIFGSETYTRQDTSFSIEKIVSIVNETDHLSLISILWQNRPATGPWIAKKAKLLFSVDNGRSEGTLVRKSSEYASVTTVTDSKDFDDQIRQEVILSSELLVHAQLPPILVDLGKSQYESMFSLLNQLLEHFACVDSESVKTSKQDSPLQISISVEFESVTISLAINPVEDSKCSMFSEVPGSWLSLTLQVNKFEVLSVSNIGGIKGASFVHGGHRQGSLWGATTEGLRSEYLLISCSDSASGRGDGEGSNVLLRRHAGSDIMSFWDPENNHNFTSITIKCATIIAVGGRLDWFRTILSFFTLESSDIEQTSNHNLDGTSGSSFTFNMVDIGLSYEPSADNLTANRGSDLKSSGPNTNESKGEPCVACLLAASSLKLSNTTVLNCTETEYKIRVQDLGFLISTASEYKLVGQAYSVEHLSKIGYVKVGQEAVIEVLLRLNCDSGHAWEVECEESHIILNTRHDTTSALIRLSAQLQKLFAPDMVDYAVHLENRWNSVQQVHANNVKKPLDGGFPSAQQLTQTSSIGKRSDAGNLMDDVCDDIFHLDGNASRAKLIDSQICESVGDSSRIPNRSSSEEEKIPDFIEEYFLVGLHPLSGLASRTQSAKKLDFADVEGRTGSTRWYGGTSLRIQEDHATGVEQMRLHKPVEDEATKRNCEHCAVDKAEGHIFLKNMNVVWRMHGGHHWPNFQNDPHTSARNHTRGSAACLELALSGIGLDYNLYPDGQICSSKVCLTIQDICLNDRSDDAPWKLMLGYYRSKKHPRKFSSNAVELNLEAVRPNPLIRIEENRLRIALLPMLLHLHQSQLDFLIGFFGENSSQVDPLQATDLALNKSGEPFEKSGNQDPAISEESFLPYFQERPSLVYEWPYLQLKFEIRPMTIRVDYHPCRVDLNALRGGKYVELVNLVPWKGVELQLKSVQGVGQYGWGTVLETILGEWLEDISQNQIRKLLKGLPPIKSLVSVSSGAAKLVSLPMKSYKKDHRLLKGMQRGTFAFLRSISLEAIELGVHLAAGTHNILLQAEYLLASIPPSVPWQVESGMVTSVKSNQPNDAQQGIQQAYQSIGDGLGKSVSALVQTPLKRYQRGAGVGSTLVTAVQSAPAAAIAPASAAARAVHCALLGFRNSLDPEHMRESLEKYLGSTPPHESMQ